MTAWLVLAAGSSSRCQPRSLHPARVFWSFPADSSLLLTACAVCAREGCTIVLQHQREASIVAGLANDKREKETPKQWNDKGSD